MRRPYDLRHSGITWRLNSGVSPTEIAAWAGHSVEMLLRVYARCVAGLEDVWISRMDATLRPLATEPDDEEPESEAAPNVSSASSRPAKPRRPTTTVGSRDDVKFGSVFEAWPALSGAPAMLRLDTYWTQTPARGGVR